MQLRQNEKGSAVLLVIMITAGLLLAGYFGIETQRTSARSESTAQATLDLGVLRAGLVAILKDAFFCPLAMNTSNAGYPPSLAPGTVPLTQIKLTSVYIQSNPPSPFNSLKVSGIQLINLVATGIPNQYVGNLHVDVAMSQSVLGLANASNVDIPISISSSAGVITACKAGP